MTHLLNLWLHLVIQFTQQRSASQGGLRMGLPHNSCSIKPLQPLAPSVLLDQMEQAGGSSFLGPTTHIHHPPTHPLKGEKHPISALSHHHTKILCIAVYGNALGDRQKEWKPG